MLGYQRTLTRKWKKKKSRNYVLLAYHTSVKVMV